MQFGTVGAGVEFFGGGGSVASGADFRFEHEALSLPAFEALVFQAHLHPLCSGAEREAMKEAPTFTCPSTFIAATTAPAVELLGADQFPTIHQLPNHAGA